MSIEIGSKWVKDGKVVEVLREGIAYIGKNDREDMSKLPAVILFKDKEKEFHILTERDFLEKYKPFQPVYEYQFLWKVKDGDCWDSVTAYHKDIQECINSECEEERGRYEYHRLDFTKRERKQ